MMPFKLLHALTCHPMTRISEQMVDQKCYFQKVIFLGLRLIRVQIVKILSFIIILFSLTNPRLNLIFRANACIRMTRRPSKNFLKTTPGRSRPRHQLQSPSSHKHNQVASTSGKHHESQAEEDRCLEARGAIQHAEMYVFALRTVSLSLALGAKLPSVTAYNKEVCLSSRELTLGESTKRSTSLQKLLPVAGATWRLLLTQELRRVF